MFGEGGRTVDRWKKPSVGSSPPIGRPAASDEFDGPGLSPQWQWNHNPVPEAWSLAARPGWLRLEARPASDMSRARNTLTQKLWDDAGVVDVRLDVSGMADGQRTGLTFISGSAFGWVGVGDERGPRRILWDQGEGPALAGTRSGCAGGTREISPGSSTASTVDPGPTPESRSRSPSPTGRGRDSGSSATGGGGRVDVDSVSYRYGAPEDHRFPVR